MTAEQALMKFLEGGVLKYEHLKFDENSQPIHPILIISMAAMDLGWQIAIESKEEDIHGVAVGSPEYMDRNFPPDKPKPNLN